MKEYKQQTDCMAFRDILKCQDEDITFCITADRCKDGKHCFRNVSFYPNIGYCSMADFHEGVFNLDEK